MLARSNPHLFILSNGGDGVSSSDTNGCLATIVEEHVAFSDSVLYEKSSDKDSDFTHKAVLWMRNDILNIGYLT